MTLVGVKDFLLMSILILKEFVLLYCSLWAHHCAVNLSSGEIVFAFYFYSSNLPCSWSCPSTHIFFVYVEGHLQAFPLVLFQNWDPVKCCQKLSTVTMTPALSWIRWHIARMLAVSSHLPALLTPLKQNLCKYFTK